MEVRARMKVLIGVDPHKASVAVAVVNQVGELLEYATFLQNRAGLNAWCELFGRNLSGRCPQIRVGLPIPIPEGKGTDSWSMRTVG